MGQRRYRLVTADRKQFVEDMQTAEGMARLSKMQSQKRFGEGVMPIQSVFRTNVGDVFLGELTPIAKIMNV